MTTVVATDSVYAGAYWPARPEALEACGARVVACLGKLAGIDELLASWFFKGSRRASAQRPLGGSPETVLQALAAGRNRRDADGSVIDELGYTLGVWNGDDADPVQLSIRCGISSPSVPNAVVLKLPARSARSTNLYNSSAATELLRALAEAWDPDWATVTSASLREAQGGGVASPVLGWLTYLSSGRGHIPELPDTFNVEPVGEIGSIIVSRRADFADVHGVTALRVALGPDLLRPAT